MNDLKPKNDYRRGGLLVPFEIMADLQDQLENPVGDEGRMLAMGIAETLCMDIEIECQSDPSVTEA